jgi:hypothetical protein
MSEVLEKDKAEAPPRDGRNPVDVSADTARQGPAGQRLLYMLIGGLLGAMLACILLYAFWGAIL